MGKEDKPIEKKREGLAGPDVKVGDAVKDDKAAVGEKGEFIASDGSQGHQPTTRTPSFGEQGKHVTEEASRAQAANAAKTELTDVHAGEGTQAVVDNIRETRDGTEITTTAKAEPLMKNPRAPNQQQESTPVISDVGTSSKGGAKKQKQKQKKSKAPEPKSKVEKPEGENTKSSCCCCVIQ